MEQGTNPFFVEQQPNVLGLPLPDHVSPSSAPDMMPMPFELSPNQNDSFPFVQDLPLPTFMQSAPHYVMHPIQPFKVAKPAQGSLTFASPPPLSLNPQQFFTPSNMINNVNGTTAHPFFVPPAASPTTPITTISSSPSFQGYTPPSPVNKELVMDEPDPSEKELASLLNGDGGLSVVDRVVSFKNLMVAGGEKQQLMYLVVLQNRHTTKACLRRFVEEGGIAVLHDWLSEAKKEFPKRRKYLLRLLDTLAVLPIGLEVLKKSQLGKTVKTISKLNDPEISDKAQKLVSSWMGLVTPQESSSVTAQSSQLQQADAPRKRSLVEAEPGVAKKKTKMVVITDSNKLAPNKPQSKPPTTPPKNTNPQPSIPVSKPKAAPKPMPTTPVNHTAPIATGGSQPQLLDEDSSTSKPKASSGKSAGATGDDLMNQLSASSKKIAGASSAVAKKKTGTTGHRMQLIEVAALPPTKVTKSSYEHKPLSADAIHKAKMKEMLLSRPSDSSATPPTSPPSPSPPSSPPPASPASTTSPNYSSESALSTAYPPPNPMYTTTATPSQPTGSIPSSSLATNASAIASPSGSLISSATLAGSVASPSTQSPVIMSFGPDGLAPLDTHAQDDAVTTTTGAGLGLVEKEPDPNRRKSSIKHPRVTWAPDDRLTDVREYVVEPDDPMLMTVGTPGAGAAAVVGTGAGGIGGVSGDTSVGSSSHAEQHRSFESARLHELQQERSIFMHMKSEEDNWRTAYQEMRPQDGLLWPRALAQIEFPPDFTFPMKGEESEEVKVQRAREAQELMVIYKDNRMAPDSPREPAIIEMDYDDSKTPTIHWDEPSANSISTSTVSPPPVPNLSQLQTLINLTQNPQPNQQPQSQQNPGIDAILSLLGGPQFVASLGDIGTFNNLNNANDLNTDVNPNVYPSHPNPLGNASNPNPVNNNMPFNPNFTGQKANMPDNLENIDNGPNLPFTNKPNNPLLLPPNPLGNIKNFGLFNFSNLGNLLSQFPSNQLPLGLLNPGGIKVNPNDPAFLSALAGLPAAAANTLFNAASMNDRGKYGRMCTYFNTPTGCRNGNQCKFSHVQPLHQFSASDREYGNKSSHMDPQNSDHTS